MATIISRRKLEPGDFDNWEARFASAAEARKQAGCRGIRRFRSVDDPNEVVVIFDWDSHENARRFIEGNVRKIQEMNPGAPAPVMQTIYVDEFEALAS